MLSVSRFVVGAFLPILACLVPTLADRLSAQSPPLPAIAVARTEHHYNPGSRIIHTLYTCMDGHRAITMVYDQSGNGRISSLARNGVLAPPSVVEEINRLLAHFDVISGLLPQCGVSDDTFFVEGMKDRARAVRLIRWSPSEVSLDMSY